MSEVKRDPSDAVAAMQATTVANLVRFVALNFPGEILEAQTKGETVDTVIIRLLSNSPSKVREEKCLDPSWAPMSKEELPKFVNILDETLMDIMRRDTVNSLRQEILTLYNAKAAMYTGPSGVESCFSRGFAGLFHNMARKWDRIEAVTMMLGINRADEVAMEEARAEGYGEAETLYVTFRDFAVYAMHAMRYIQGQMKKLEKAEATKG